jgi:hypothetical protein
MLRIELRLAFINDVLLANRVLIFRFQVLAVYVLLQLSFSEIPTRFLTPYREFEQRPHTPHWRQLDSNSRYGIRKYSRVTSTLVHNCGECRIPVIPAKFCRYRIGIRVPNTGKPVLETLITATLASVYLTEFSHSPLDHVQFELPQVF